MGKGIIILIIIGIFVVMGIVRDGVDTLKSEPVQSIWDSSKDIVDAGKNIVNKFQGDENTTATGLIEVGQIPCANDADCNILPDCEYYLCVCQGGSCFLK